MKSWVAEIIAIGDELVSGQRLDTNTRWISQQLGELGIVATFHTTVGDDLVHKQEVFRNAVRRANIVICTGGLGPTADDLTREVIASTANAPLERKPEVVEKLRQMYRARNREMPESNLCQADFPAGSVVIANPEGTAPGIDLSFSPVNDGRHTCRILALPGVPAELKQMWTQSVRPALQTMMGSASVIHYRTLHVFGEGESKIESMLPDLVRRGNDPTTGITASAATITLRVSTSGASREACDAKIEPILMTIRDCLGELVFGSDGQTLADVVFDTLKDRGHTLAIVDGGLRGEIATALAAVDVDRIVMRNALMPDTAGFSEFCQPRDKSDKTARVAAAARRIRDDNNADFGLAIDPINRDLKITAAGESKFHVGIVGPDASGKIQTTVNQYVYRGHSSWRQQRAVKQALNQLRLFLQ